jgi:hypothetical protein
VSFTGTALLTGHFYMLQPLLEFPQWILGRVMGGSQLSQLHVQDGRFTVVFT